MGINHSRQTLWLAASAILAAGVMGGCAGRSRVLLVDTPAHARAASDLTAREWGFRLLQAVGADVTYHSIGLAGPSDERLRLQLTPIEKGEVRATAKFTGPTAGAERFFLSDLQHNISTGTILPVMPAK